MTYTTLVNLRGVNHRPAYVRNLVENLDPEVKLELKRDHENKYDHSAIKVFLGEDWLGWIEAGGNKQAAALMDDGHLVECITVTETGDPASPWLLRLTDKGEPA